MTTQKKSPTRAATVSATKQQVAKTISEDADRRIRERNQQGQFLARITPEEWDWVIDRVRAGDTDANIARHFGLNSGAIAVKRREDASFSQRYMEALEDAFVTIAQETRDVARGIEGASTGDVVRDRLVVETDLKLASKFARKILGDKVQVEQTGMVVHIAGGASIMPTPDNPTF